GAGGMPARWVIHTVGPDRRRGQTDPALLASCFRRSLAVAEEVGATSVAFPAVSAGVFGWDPAQVADVAVSTVRETLPATPGVERVRFVLFSAELHRLFEGALQR
ncbi:macro domain-containing protein, partial [Ornithinicoccus halotolerans]|uniref:macro domain-containing protein n=1 Tax=Ornithinicoccus halotolerans TaxID=1748220 RepID=UPI0018864AA1